MANVLTIQLRPTRKYDKPSVANLFHNSGLSKATYWLKDADSIISNLDLKNLTTKQAVDLWRTWEKEAINLVLKNKGKKPQKRQVLIEEGLLVIGKDVLEKDPKIFIEIFEEFKKWFEKKYNTKILAYFFHNHEGHVNLKEGEFLENLHIHFFFLNVDKEGNSVRRQIKKTDLSYFQSKIYEIGKKYIPTLERATNYKELGLKAPKHLSHREYRTQKIKYTQLRLAPEIKSIKKENKELKEENKELLAKVKDLKELNNKVRALYKELGAKREDYAKLEQLNKELKEKIKAKNLTIEEMQEEFNKQLQELKIKLKEEQEKKEKLKDLAYSKKYTYSDTEKPVPNAEVVEYLEKKLNNREKKIEELQKKLMQSENRVQQLEEENKKLKEKLERLKEEIKKETKENAKIKGYTNFTEFLDAKEAAELEKRGIITGVERTNNAKLIIYTDTLSLKEEEKNEFEIDKQKPLNEEEIEQAILILVKLRHWDISKIEANGSKSFVEKANRVLEKLKIELKGEQEDISYKPRFKP